MFETGMSDPGRGLRTPDTGGPQGMLGGGERHRSSDEGHEAGWAH